MKPYVKLLAHTPDPEKVIATAAKLCYSSSSINDLYEGLTDEVTTNFLEKLMNMGHESPIEHISFTFGIEGISRACSHQLVRHRIASYSQQSQRYVNMNSFEYITPPSIKSNENLNKAYIDVMKYLTDQYEAIQSILAHNIATDLVNNGMDEKKAKSIAEKQANEDARFILPNACETKIVVTMNARSLFNFFSHRCCNRAQWEIRELAEKMYKLVYPIAPTLFSHAGPSCVVTGKCPEGSMTCGKIKDMKKKYELFKK